MRDSITKLVSISFFGGLIGRGLRYGFNVVIARGLGFEALGVFAFGMVVMKGGGVFVRLGLDSAAKKFSNNTIGVDVFDEDWDTLVVLDACRYDMFESTSQLKGTLSSRISKGSSTVEWLQANFDGRDLSDTVYVTANPQLERNRHEWDINLHETINVWLEEGWDEETGTVRAEPMTQAALDAADRFPHKRLVVHYR